MKPADFYKKIGLLFVSLLVLVAGLSRIHLFQDTFYFSAATILLFLIFTIGVYHLAAKAVHSPNKNLYSTVAISSIIVKLILMLAMLFTYQAIAQPTSRLFLVPFIFIYLVFTAFETSVLMKLAKPKK